MKELVFNAVPTLVSLYVCKLWSTCMYDIPQPKASPHYFVMRSPIVVDRMFHYLLTLHYCEVEQKKIYIMYYWFKHGLTECRTCDQQVVSLKEKEKQNNNKNILLNVFNHFQIFRTFNTKASGWQKKSYNFFFSILGFSLIASWKEKCWLDK